MRTISNKRKEENLIYRDTKKRLFLSDLKSGRLVCFFTQKKIVIPAELRYESDDVLMKYLTCHHLNQERDNERLFDENMMVPVLDKYHNDYHSLSVVFLLQTNWYYGFLERLKIRAPEVYNKEIRKQLKAGLITIEQYEQITT
jgi:hypothetical protein